MGIKYFAAGLLLLGMLTASARAVDAPSPAQDLAHLQTICLKSNQLCRYIEFDFAGSGHITRHEVVFVPLTSDAERAFWNRRAAAHLKSDATADHVRAAIYDASTHEWKPSVTDSHCPLCVPGTARFDGKTRQWFRFETDNKLQRNEYSAWIFTQIVGREDHSRLFVVVRQHNGPVICASARNSGMHYQYSTAKTGGFRIPLESDWVQSARPDYVTISPVCSWASLAKQYMNMQAKALVGSDQLPTFNGTVQEKVNAAIGYIKARNIQYDATPDVGGYPRQDVAKILKEHRTDCKGFTTLLYALLRKAGVESAPVLLNAHGMTPMSFSVPDHWFNHVILYVPGLDRYIDLTVSLPSHGEYTWQTSANPYAGDVVLNLVKGRFDVVPSHLIAGGD
jgi:transglutaminase-like putative cysteine protease